MAGGGEARSMGVGGVDLKRGIVNEMMVLLENWGICGVCGVVVEIRSLRMLSSGVLALSRYCNHAALRGEQRREGKREQRLEK